MQEMQVPSLGREEPLEEEQQPTPVFLPGKSQGQRSLAGYSPRGHKIARHNLVMRQQAHYKLQRPNFELDEINYPI